WRFSTSHLAITHRSSLARPTILGLPGLCIHIHSGASCATLLSAKRAIRAAAGTSAVRTVSTGGEGTIMLRFAYRLIPLLLLAFPGFPQTDDYAPEKENVIQRTKPGKQLHKEDEPCGSYF